MTLSYAPGTDMSLRASHGVVSRGPETAGLYYRPLGLYRVLHARTLTFHWFLTRRGMLRWFEAALAARSPTP